MCFIFFFRVHQSMMVLLYYYQQHWWGFCIRNMYIILFSLLLLEIFWFKYHRLYIYTCRLVLFLFDQLKWERIVACVFNYSFWWLATCKSPKLSTFKDWGLVSVRRRFHSTCHYKRNTLLMHTLKSKQTHCIFKYSAFKCNSFLLINYFVSFAKWLRRLELPVQNTQFLAIIFSSEGTLKWPRWRVVLLFYIGIYRVRLVGNCVTCVKYPQIV